MSESEFSIIYVVDNKAVLICPYCGHWKTIFADPFRGAKHKLKIKCLCQETFKVFLEFRKKVRKKIFLKGTCINHSQKGSRCDISVLDISVIGLAFSSSAAPILRINDELGVEFTLNFKKGTDVKRDVIVRNINHTRVGCEFELYGGAFDDQLGQYVMS